MPLQIIDTADAAADRAARQLLQQILSIAQRTVAARKDGIPEQPAVPARSLPNGVTVPGREAVPAISAADLDAAFAALGEQNIPILDALGGVLG